MTDIQPIKPDSPESSPEPLREPRRCNLFAHYLGRFVLWISGWTCKGGPPPGRDMVIIAAPHTTNWDFIFLLAAAYKFRLSINWLGKNSLFFWPFSYLLRYLGGIPVNRSRSTDMVKRLAEEIRAGQGTILVIPPAGTRGYTEYWKSGFYRIAEAAEIPLVCGYLDYPKKEAGLGHSFLPGDLIGDMDKLRAFYEPIEGKFPDRKSRIRLRDEDQQMSA